MILCCGEALIDMIPEQDGSYTPHVGGSVFNTAIGLGRLETPVGFFSGLSRDQFGEQLAAALTASNVATGYAVRSDRLTTLAFVQIDDGHVSYSFYDENSAGRMLSKADLPTLGPNVTALYFGGISLACEPAADVYAALLEREADTRPVMLDPNIRLGFAEDEARYRARLDRLISRSDIVKVSDEDLDWLVTEPLTETEKAARLLAKGPSVVIVTKGQDGATGYLADGNSVSVPSISVEVADTVGAGDTFNSGVLCALQASGMLTKNKLENLPPESLREALDFAAKVAARTVSRKGADPPWAHEL